MSHEEWTWGKLPCELSSDVEWKKCTKSVMRKKRRELKKRKQRILKLLEK